MVGWPWRARPRLVAAALLGAASHGSSYSAHPVAPFCNCTVAVPELPGAFVSTQIEFVSPRLGSVHAAGSSIALEVALLVLPSMPPPLAARLSLCLQVRKYSTTS